MAVPSSQHQQRLANATYVLRLTDGGATVGVPGHPIASGGVLTLMLPPQSLRPQQTARIGFMETRSGVITDEQGMSPPTWDLSGQFSVTTATLDGVRLDHYQQQRALESFIRYYLEQNRVRAEARQTLLRLEWHDFYSDEHWFVAPLGVPLGERDSSRPLIERWSLRLRGLARTTAAARAPDPVLGRLLADPNAAIAMLCPVDGAPVNA